MPALRHETLFGTMIDRTSAVFRRPVAAGIADRTRRSVPRRSSRDAGIVKSVRRHAMARVQENRIRNFPHSEFTVPASCVLNTMRCSACHCVPRAGTMSGSRTGVRPPERKCTARPTHSAGRL